VSRKLGADLAGNRQPPLRLDDRGDRIVDNSRLLPPMTGGLHSEVDRQADTGQHRVTCLVEKSHARSAGVSRRLSRARKRTERMTACPARTERRMRGGLPTSQEVARGRSLMPMLTQRVNLASTLSLRAPLAVIVDLIKTPIRA
jgi:hypothetical protein